MKKNEEIIEPLNKNEEFIMTTKDIAHIATVATRQANENAKKTKVPLLVIEENNLLEIKADGSKHFVKAIKKSNQQIAKHFKLK